MSRGAREVGGLEVSSGISVDAIVRVRESKRGGLLPLKELSAVFRIGFGELAVGR